MKKLIFDTNILIDYFRVGHGSRFAHFFDEPKYSSGVSAATVQEVMIGKSSLDQARDLKEFFSSLVVYPVDFEVGWLAGELIRDNFMQKSSFVDAQIAATALVNNCQLVTLNKKHFEQVKGLVLWEE